MNSSNLEKQRFIVVHTLESGIDVGQGINVGHEQNVHIYVTKKQ